MSSSVTEEGVCVLARSLPSLVLLDLTGTGVKDRGVAEIANGGMCPCLVMLIARYIHILIMPIDHSVMSLELILNALLCLDSYLRMPPLKCGAIICAGCTDLMVLRLNTCGGVTDVGLTHVGARLTCLRELDIKSSYVTDAALEHMCSTRGHQGALHVLSVAHCRNLTSKGGKIAHGHIPASSCLCPANPLVYID